MFSDTTSYASTSSSWTMAKISNPTKSPLTLVYCFGQIWPVFTFDNSENTLNILLFVWNLMTFPKVIQNSQKLKYFHFYYLYFCLGAINCCSPRLFWVKIDPYLFNFRSTNVGQIKENGGLRESWNCKTVQETGKWWNSSRVIISGVEREQKLCRAQERRKMCQHGRSFTQEANTRG